MATGTYGYSPAVDEEAAHRREALVLQHLPQVRLIAKRIHDRLPDYVALRGRGVRKRLRESFVV